jgi:hypothetical protein
MLRRLCLLVTFVLVSGVLVPARAQGLADKIELSAGYAYMHFKSSPAVNLNGFDVSGQYKLKDWLSGVADVGGEFGTVGGVSSHVYTYTFGPQVSWPRRVSPFAQALFGFGYFSGGGYTNRSLAANYGAGVDVKIKAKLSWRVIEADLVTTRLGGVSEHSTRISTGIVYRFGR